MEMVGVMRLFSIATLQASQDVTIFDYKRIAAVLRTAGPTMRSIAAISIFVVHRDLYSELNARF